LMLIRDRKYKKLKKKNDVNNNSITIFCSVSYQTLPMPHLKS